MGKYLIITSYSTDGIKGVLAKGGTARKSAAEATLTAMGGTLESFHFAFGGDDAYIVAELPDNVSAAALALQVGASGMVSTRTVVLLTPEEIDRAAQTKVTYQPPGA